VRRLLVIGGLTLALAACGGTDQNGQTGQTPRASKPAKTKTQLAAEKLLKQLDGSDCDCTGEARAKERIENGKAVRHEGSVVLAP
jgi:hypothetical protein